MDKARLYFGEIQTQISFAKRAFEEYKQALTISDVVSVFYHTHHFLIHATNIDKLIDVDISSFRGKYIAPLFSGQAIDLKQFRRLRNHLEHFDERLDKWAKNFSGHAFFDMNIITGAKGFPKKAFLRAMDGQIFRFHGEDYDLNALYSEIEKIERLINNANQRFVTGKS
ncbi:MAG: hypothetical protein ACOZF2_06640 [Thermodesulfobacteriota bacterium]